MVDSVFKILGSALAIWEHKEKHKYLDQYIALKREYYAEFNKPREERSSAILDDVLLRVRILGDSWVAAAQAKAP